MRRAGATLCCCAWASHCGGFSRCGARALGLQASVVVACRVSSCGLQALEHRLSSCGARAHLLRGTWDLPRLGLEPVSPALAGGFLTTAPPGKPLKVYNFICLAYVYTYEAITTNKIMNITISPKDSSCSLIIFPSQLLFFK